MELIVHRGTQQIGGGSCVEVRTGNTRIIFDVGIPLDADPYLPKKFFRPKVEGLFDDLPDSKLVDAVFLSHFHPDHSEFARAVNSKIPIYMSEGTKVVMDTLSLFLQRSPQASNIKTLKTRRREEYLIGNVKIEPVAVCHSAPDSLGFIIAAEDKTIVYSGDFRSHGRKGVLFDAFIKRCPRSPEILLLEGTMVGNDRNRETVPERDIEKAIVEQIKTNDKWPLLVNFSPTNPDRFISFLRACLKTKSILVVDLLTAYIYSKLKDLGWNIPHIAHPVFRILFFEGHKRALRNANEENFFKRLAGQEMKVQELLEGRQTLLLFRASHIFNYKNVNFRNVRLINSTWSGVYPGQELTMYRFKSYIRKNQIQEIQIHTSGHAPEEELVRFADMVKPKLIVPIHSNCPEKYKDLFANHTVRQLNDGEKMSL